MIKEISNRDDKNWSENGRRKGLLLICISSVIVLFMGAEIAVGAMPLQPETQIPTSDALCC